MFKIFKNITKKIAYFVAPEYIRSLTERASNTEQKINQRVAIISANIDPVNLLMREYNGVFSEEFERPEDRLNNESKVMMYMWAFQQEHDPHFQHMTQWIMDTCANETIKRAPLTPERIQYGRAQISNMVLLRKEIGRLSLLYQEMLEKNKGNRFDSSDPLGQN